MKGRILVVDDEKNLVIVLQAVLERAGFEVLAFHDPREALEAIAAEDLDIVITDLKMPEVGGMEILAATRQHQPQVPVVMITAFGTVESAVSALKSGAFDFVTKPFEQSELLAVIEKAWRTRQASSTEPGPVLDTPVESAKGADLRRSIDRFAAADTAVLIAGESGTGKELVALDIHRRSKRAGKPFIRLNCAAVPPDAIESELFGVERGASMGVAQGEATVSKPGRFELADEGTLFLDEVGVLPPAVQTKLAHAIGLRPGDLEIERVGAATGVRLNVRIVAATNVPLIPELREKLRAEPVELPPLRERHEDIERFARGFLEIFSERFEKKVRRIDPPLLAALQGFEWPGNLRQLENVMERMVLRSDSETLGVADLPEEIATLKISEALGFKEIVRRQTQATERGLIEQALEETDGNVTRTAEKLGLSRKGLQLKMKELGIRRS